MVEDRRVTAWGSPVAGLSGNCEIGRSDPVNDPALFESAHLAAGTEEAVSAIGADGLRRRAGFPACRFTGLLVR